MKAPDKIYIGIERTYGASNGQVIGMVTPHNERQSVNDIEYVRKDAVLEWAKEKEDYALTREVKLAYKTMIEKLNAM